MAQAGANTSEPEPDVVRRVMGLVIRAGVLPLTTPHASAMFELAATTKALFGDADVQRALAAEGKADAAVDLDAIKAACRLCALQPQERALAELRFALVKDAVQPSAFGLRAFVEAARVGHVLVLQQLLAHPRTRRNFELGRPLATAIFCESHNAQGFFIETIYAPSTALYRALNDVCVGDADDVIVHPFAAVLSSLAGSADSLEWDHLPYARTHEQADETLARVLAEMLRVPLLAQSVRERELPEVLCRKRLARSLRVLLDYEPRVNVMTCMYAVLRMPMQFRDPEVSAEIVTRVVDVVDEILRANMDVRTFPYDDILAHTMNFVGYAGSSRHVVRESARVDLANAVVRRVATNSLVLSCEKHSSLMREIFKFASMDTEELVDCLHAMVGAAQLRHLFSVNCNVHYVKIQGYRALTKAIKCGHGRIVRAILRSTRLVDVLLMRDVVYYEHARPFFMCCVSLYGNAAAATARAESMLDKVGGGSGSGGLLEIAAEEARAALQRRAVMEYAMVIEPRLACTFDAFLVAELAASKEAEAEAEAETVWRGERMAHLRCAAAARGLDGAAASAAAPGAGEKRKRLDAYA